MYTIKQNISLKTAYRLFIYRKKTALVLSIASVLAVSALVAPNFKNTKQALAAPTPDSCFAYTTADGEITITDYYDHEDNNPANPACTKDVEIPSTIGGATVTAITGPGGGSWYGAFTYKDITSVTLPNTLTSIGDYAFSNNQLTSVIIPDSVTSLGERAFSDNPITSLSIGPIVSDAGFTWFGVTNGSSSLTSLTITGSPATINDSAFSGSQLTSVTIPSSVTSIGEHAFSNNQLTSVTIPSSVTRIENGAFSNNQLTSVTIPSSVTYLSGFGDNQLTSIHIPSSVETIGNGAFMDNVLNDVSFDQPSQLTTIENHAFAHEHCNEGKNPIVNITFPQSLQTIGDSAFLCNRLESLVLPNSVTSVGPQAFMGNRISSITLSNALEELRERSFATNNIQSVTIPNSITAIDNSAFFGQVVSEGTSFIDVMVGGSTPELIEAFMSSVIYAQLYTESPTNPRGFTDSLVTELSVGGGDLNGDGDDTDSMGGHLINPAQANITYKHQEGDNLSPAQTFTGPGLATYLAKDNPTNDLSLYYKAGDSDTFTPSAIPGFVTPPAQTVAFVLGANTINFVYQAEGGSSSGQDIGGNSPPAALDQQAGDSSSPLASTGTVVVLLVTAATAIVILTVSMAAKARRPYKYKVL